MVRVSFWMILCSSMLLAVCSMQIEKVDIDPEKYTLILQHDKNCEILMDHNKSHISLAVKRMEVSAKEKDENLSTNGTVEKIIALAKSKIGNSYEPAKAGPDHFDCSGFVFYVFTHNGIKIPRTSRTQSESGVHLSREQIQRGDILFFDTHDRKHINHSGIYLGEGKFIHASSGKAYGVTISDLDKGFYKDKFRWGVRKTSAAE